jgi:hypothetical protein
VYLSGQSGMQRFIHFSVHNPDRRWLHSDERGSVIAISNGTGSVTTINAYDEFGIPGANNAGRFRYSKPEPSWGLGEVNPNMAARNWHVLLQGAAIFAVAWPVYANRSDRIWRWPELV